MRVRRLASETSLVGFGKAARWYRLKNDAMEGGDPAHMHARGGPIAQSHGERVTS